MEYARYSHVGKVREKNEDNCYADGTLFIIADGMGGYSKGEVASQAAVSYCAEQLKNRHFTHPRDVEYAIETTITGANEEIVKLSELNEDGKCMGTTLSLGYIFDNTFFIGHVGDSRIYLIRDELMLQLTTDHSLVNEMMRLGQMEDEPSFPQRNIITRALGLRKDIEVDVHSLDLKHKDILLFTTDGVTNMVPDEEMKDIVLAGRDLGLITQELIKTANAKGGTDNMTVVLIQYDKHARREVFIHETR